MKVEKTDEAVISVKFDSRNAQVLWLNDLHIDSKHTDLQKVRKIIDSNPDAKLIIGGDLWDAMQNVGDKRGSKSDLTLEMKGDNYTNRMVDLAFDFFKPYADRIIAFHYGNHETAQIKYYGVDLTQFLVAIMNKTLNANILINDFAGYYVFLLEHNPNKYISKIVYYSHRPISGGARSKGMLSSDIVSGRYPDADIYISEHIHTSFSHPFTVEKISSITKTKAYEEKWYIQMPTMKAEDKGGKMGYHNQRNYAPVWNGAILLDFSYDRGTESEKGVRRILLNPKWIRA